MRKFLPISNSLVHAADEQPLVIKLQRDAQIKFAAERVVIGLERLRRRAAGNRLHHRRLDFHIAAPVEEIPDFADDGAALEHHVLHVGIRDQIEIALAVADFGVFEAVPFAGRRAQRLGEDGEAASLMEISPVLVVNSVPLTPTKSPRSRCVKMWNCSSPRTFFCA